MPQQADFSEEVDSWRQSTAPSRPPRYLKQHLHLVISGVFNPNTSTFCYSSQQQQHSPQHLLFPHLPRSTFHPGPLAGGINTPNRGTRNEASSGTLDTTLSSPCRRQFPHRFAPPLIRARARVLPANFNLRIKTYFAGILTYQTGTGPYFCIFPPQHPTILAPSLLLPYTSDSACLRTIPPRQAQSALPWIFNFMWSTASFPCLKTRMWHPPHCSKSGPAKQRRSTPVSRGSCSMQRPGSSKNAHPVTEVWPRYDKPSGSNPPPTSGTLSETSGSGG